MRKAARVGNAASVEKSLARECSQTTRQVAKAIDLIMGEQTLFLGRTSRIRRRRRLARWLHGGRKAVAGSSQRDSRSRSLQRMVRRCG